MWSGRSTRRVSPTPHVREYVAHWANITGAERIEVVSAADDARLIQESLDAGELLPAGEGLYYSRSYYKDTARAEERTIVATSNEADKGVYNNWKPSAEMKPKLVELMTGASEGKTMYVIPPYLMSPKGSPVEKFAAGVELTDNRNVVLQMIRMARVGVEYINDLGDSFVKAVHVTGDLENLGQGTPDDKRYFVTVADERTILHFGSSYGGNALLGKIAHGLRQGAYDGWKNGFLVEQFMLLGITDKQTGKKYNICGGFPSASGKTNLAMTLAPRRPRRPLLRRVLRRRHRVDLGRRRRQALRHEPGERCLRCRQGHQREDQPDRDRLDRPGHRRHLHQRRLQRQDPGGLVGGQEREADRPRRLGGLEGRHHRRPGPRERRRPVGAPEQPLHHHAGQRAQRREGLRGP